MMHHSAEHAHAQVWATVAGHSSSSAELPLWEKNIKLNNSFFFAA